MRIITETESIIASALFRFDAQLVDRLIRLPTTTSCTNHLLQAVIYWGLVVSSFLVLYVEWLLVHLALLRALASVIMRGLSFLLLPLYFRLKSLSKPRLCRLKLFRRRLTQRSKNFVRMNRPLGSMAVIETPLGGKVFYDKATNLPTIERPHPDDPSGEPTCPCCPDPVSGHRMLVVGDYGYVFGGLCENRNNLESRVSTDLWRFCIIDASWKKFPLQTEVLHMTPISYSWIFTEKWGILTFGGTCFPFGSNNGQRLCRIHIFEEEDNYTSLPLRSDGEHPLESYGGVLIADEPNNCVYYMGGTDGHAYFSDLYRGDISVHGDRKVISVSWRKIRSGPMNAVDGRYRHEGVLHDGKLLFFGGGDQNTLFPLDIILAYDIKKAAFSNIVPIEDPIHGFPPARDSFAIAQYGDYVYLIGGRGNLEARRNLEDIWQLDLNTSEWKKRDMTLSFSTSFHAAAVDSDGRIFVFGGHRGTSTSPNNIHRTNMVQSFLVQPPTLQNICKRVFTRTYKRGINFDEEAFASTRKFVRTAMSVCTQKVAEAS